MAVGLLASALAACTVVAAAGLRERPHRQWHQEGQDRAPDKALAKGLAAIRFEELAHHHTWGPPKFTVKTGLNAETWGPFNVSFLTRHPLYVEDEEAADMVLAAQGKFTWKHTYPKFFDELGQRSPAKPWVVWAHNLKLEKCGGEVPVALCTSARRFMSRKDILFVNYDLRDYMVTNDSVAPLRGVTMPPKGSPRRGTPPPELLEVRTKYLLTFRGDDHPGWWQSSHARPDLKSAFEGQQDPRVVLEFAEGKCENCPVSLAYTPWERDRYDDLLMNSSFALVPHGDGRWESRFSEVVGACVIPVVMADGLTLPFEEIIDWFGASVRIEERWATQPSELLRRLPQDPKVVARMRRRVCEIHHKYFATEEAKVRGLALALRQRMRFSSAKAEPLSCPPSMAQIRTAKGRGKEDTVAMAAPSPGLDTVHVVYCSDAGGFDGMLHSMLSLAKHLSMPDKAVIHVIAPPADLDDAQARVHCFQRELGKPAPQVMLHEMLPPPSLPSSQNYPPQAFTRLHIAQYLPELPRAIWLDVDTVVLADVRPLYLAPMSHAVAAVHDGALSTLQSWSSAVAVRYPNVHEAMMSLSQQDFINTGVLLFDLKLWQELDLTERVSRVITQVQGWGADQLAMSIALKGEIEMLDWRWNMLGLADRVLSKQCDAKILHWAGHFGGKPWQEGHFAYNDHFYRAYAPREQCASQM